MAVAIAEEDSRPGSAAFFLGPATLVVLLMLAAPLLLIARYSVNRFDPTQLMIDAVTPHNYATFFTDPFYLSVMRTTIVVAVVVTLLCVLLGVPISARIARMPPAWKPVAMLLVILPLFVGSTVRTVGWLILFTRGGMLDILATRLFGRHVDLMYSEPAVIVAIVSVNLPFTILTLQSVFEGIDTRLEEAARGLGAAPSRAFFRITWPLALPGILIGAILCFILAMNAYATPLLVGGPRFAMMAPLIYYEFATNNDWPLAASLAILLMATTLVLATVANRVIGGKPATSR